jgi:hypothetical protein
MSDNRTACPKCGYLCTGKLPDTHSPVEKEETQEDEDTLWNEVEFSIDTLNQIIPQSTRNKFTITRKQ